MVKIEEADKRGLSGFNTEKTMYCPTCGHKHVCYCMTPENCIGCSEKLPDLIESVESNLAPAKKLEYHNVGIVSNSLK